MQPSLIVIGIPPGQFMRVLKSVWASAMVSIVNTAHCTPELCDACLTRAFQGTGPPAVANQAITVASVMWAGMFPTQT